MFRKRRIKRNYDDALPPPAEEQAVKIRAGQATYLILQYIYKKLREQIRSVAFITIFLVIVQTLILGIPIRDAAGIALGVAAVVFGLAFFLEGLFLGIMPLAESCGRSLPGRDSQAIWSSRRRL